MAKFSNEVALVLDDRRFRHWDKLRVQRSIDNIDSLECSAPFDEGEPVHRTTFQPVSYKSLNVVVNDAPLFTGTMVPCVPGGDAVSTTVAIGAYALPGVLGQCPPPASTLPGEYAGMDLQDIAAEVCDPFDITVLFRKSPGPGPAFDSVVREPDQTVLSFLVELAQTRGFVISSTPSGALLFWKAVTSGTPVATLVQGSSPLIGVTPTFHPESYFSEITGLRPVRTRAKKSVQFTVRNTLLPGVVRPHTFKVNDAKDGDIESAVLAKQGRMFANMVSYDLAVATWRDATGNLWEPNTIVRVHAPRKMIYQPYDFVIRSVTFRKGASAETTVLRVVLPGSFTNEQPARLPWVE